MVASVNTPHIDTKLAGFFGRLTSANFPIFRDQQISMNVNPSNPNWPRRLPDTSQRRSGGAAVPRSKDRGSQEIPSTTIVYVFRCYRPWPQVLRHTSVSPGLPTTALPLCPLSSLDLRAQLHAFLNFGGQEKAGGPRSQFNEN